MDPISKLNRLLEALRLQQASSGKAGSKRTESVNPLKHAASHSKRSGELPAKLSLEQLNRRISERINQLPPEEKSSDKAVQLFIDSVLAWEFGEGLLGSSSFTRYSNKIRTAINSDSNLSYEFKQLLNSLSES
jgi:hypothetical protein